MKAKDLKSGMQIRCLDGTPESVLSVDERLGRMWIETSRHDHNVKDTAEFELIDDPFLRL